MPVVFHFYFFACNDIWISIIMVICVFNFGSVKEIEKATKHQAMVDLYFIWFITHLRILISKWLLPVELLVHCFFFTKYHAKDSLLS